MPFERSISYSPAESRRFKLRVYRGVIDEIKPEEILSTVYKNAIDIVIIRIPIEKQKDLFLLEFSRPHIRGRASRESKNDQPRNLRLFQKL